MLRIERLKGYDRLFDFFIGKHKIGGAQKTDEGWIVHGLRKPRLTDESAAKTMLDLRINRLNVEIEQTRRLYDALRIYCGGKLPEG